MRPWQFRQKTIGFGITKNCYYTVMTGKAQMPSPVQILNPKAENGALEGFIVPLTKDSTKEDLERPLARGQYAASTRDRKTVLRVMVLSKEEAGFDPGPFLRSPIAKNQSPELLGRISATWSLIQVTFESHDPFVHPSLRFVLGFCGRVAELTEGVIADPISQTYKLPNELFHQPQADPKVDARDFVSLQERVLPEGINLSTLGMQKFAQPELEMFGVAPGSVEVAQTLLMSLCQKSLLGELYEVGDRFGDAKVPFQLAHGGLDRARWEGIPCLEVLPPPGIAMSAALGSWISAQRNS